jgi:hypothetical protein
METSTKQNEMNIFLRLKHWQAFGILLAVPMIFKLVTMVSLVTNTSVLYLIFAAPFHAEARAALFSAVSTEWVAGYLAAMAVAMVIIAAWLYSLGVGLCKKIPPQASLRTTVFRVWLFLSLACHLVVLAFGYFLFVQLSAGGEVRWKQLLPAVLLCVISSVGLCYAFCFTAKALKTAERGQTVTFGEYVPELLGILIYPVGIWFIQPRVNKLVESSKI